MQDEITKLYYSKDPLCADGREFLVSRGLSIPVAYKCGICSKDGQIYFLYFRDGEPVRWKSRLISDKKKQFMSKLPEADKDKFQMPLFSHSKVPPLTYLIITEGEFDCVALTQLGASNCVSLPNGAQSVEATFRNNYKYLQEFDRIYIAFDMDKAGEEAAAKAAKMIHPAKYRRLVFPCKDANQWLMENPEIELADLQLLMENARSIQDAAVTNLSDLPASYYDEIHIGCSTGWKGLDKILLGMRTGEVTVVTGDTGSGKTTFCMNLMCNLLEKGYPIWVNSYEMKPEVVMRKIAGIGLQKKMKFAAFSDLDRANYQTWLTKNNCYLNNSNRKTNLLELRKQLELASLAYSVKYVLLDHLDYLYSDKGTKSTLEALDATVQEVHQLAMEFDVGIVLVVHPKQTTANQEISLHDLKGSSSIKQYADNILVITRMDRINSNDPGRVKVRVWKNRLSGKEGQISLLYQEETDSYKEKAECILTGARQ